MRVPPSSALSSLFITGTYTAALALDNSIVLFVSAFLFLSLLAYAHWCYQTVMRTFSSGILINVSGTSVLREDLGRMGVPGVSFTHASDASLLT